MLPRTALLMALAASVVASGSVRAEWPAAYKDAYLDECRKTCRSNFDAGGEAHKMKCPGYCQCTVDEGEKIFSADEFVQMDRDASTNQETLAIKRFTQTMEFCAKRVWRRED